MFRCKICKKFVTNWWHEIEEHVANRHGKLAVLGETVEYCHENSVRVS